MLKRCGSFIKSERAYMALYDMETRRIQYSCEWQAEDTSSQPEVFQEPDLGIRSILSDQFDLHNMIKVPDTGAYAANGKAQGLACKPVCSRTDFTTY